MGHAIRITVGDLELAAELNDSATAREILDALPIEAAGSLWGDEIYFSIPVHCDAEPEARTEFDVGELGYWPPGNAFCIFYGPTPASHGEQPTMANPGNPIGRILDDTRPLKQASHGVTVRIERA